MTSCHDVRLCTSGGYFDSEVEFCVLRSSNWPFILIAGLIRSLGIRIIETNVTFSQNDVYSRDFPFLGIPNPIVSFEPAIKPS
jgi:hypothetical protein